MSDLISRQAALDGITDIFEEWKALDIEEVTYALQEVSERLQNLPTAEKKGKWMPYNDMWECSVCGNVVYAINKADLKVFNAYCGMCGSRMEV